MRLPRPRPWLQYAQMGVAALACTVLAWLLLAGPVQIPYPEGNAGFYAVLALTCLLIGAAVLAIFRVLVIRYWPMTAGQRQDLATRTLIHYTTREAAARIMGVVAIPAAGLTGTAQLLTQQLGALTGITRVTGGRTAVFAWTGLLAHPRLHQPACGALIEFSGASLPDPTAVRWHPNGALRIAGGYQGPATARLL